MSLWPVSLDFRIGQNGQCLVQVDIEVPAVMLKCLVAA
jgi:hypothetical protein